MNQSDIDIFFAALCCWREDRGGSPEERLGQLCVIRNRVRADWLKDNTYQDVVEHPYQFSAMSDPGDPNLIKNPRSTDPAWLSILPLAEQVILGQQADITSGAVFYYSDPLTQPPHGWGPVVHSCDIGKLHFFQSPFGSLHEPYH